VRFRSSNLSRGPRPKLAIADRCGYFFAVNKFLLAVAALSGISGPAWAQDLGGWNTPREALPLTGECEPVLDIFTIKMVVPDHVDWAITALSQSESIPLTEARAEELTGEPRPSGVNPEARPFLVRAVMGARTGWFQIYPCSAGLFVGHGSMSQEPPIPSRVPLVVWLLRQPIRVYATWVFAQ
jgi:hypothetical protein